MLINKVLGVISGGLSTWPLGLPRAKIWQAGQNAAAVPEEDEDREDADNVVFIPNKV